MRTRAALRHGRGLVRDQKTRPDTSSVTADACQAGAGRLTSGATRNEGTSNDQRHRWQRRRRSARSCRRCRDRGSQHRPGTAVPRLGRRRGRAATHLDTHRGGHLPAGQRGACATCPGLGVRGRRAGIADRAPTSVRPPGPPARRHRHGRPMGRRRPLPRAASRRPARGLGIPWRPGADLDGPSGGADQRARQHRHRRVQRRHHRPLRPGHRRRRHPLHGPPSRDRGMRGPPGGPASLALRHRVPAGADHLDGATGPRGHLPSRADRPRPGLLLHRHAHRGRHPASGRAGDRAACRAPGRLRRTRAGHPRHPRPR